MLSEQEWESLCNQCGKCCYLWKDNDTRSDTEACCLLDKETKQCTEYKDRFNIKRKLYNGTRRCVKLEEDMLERYYETKFLPDDCAYMKYWKTLNEDNKS